MKRSFHARRSTAPTPVAVEQRVRRATESRCTFQGHVLDEVREFLEAHAMGGKTGGCEL